MAEIDKSLPNEVIKTIEIEKPEEAAVEVIQEQESIPNPGEVSVTEKEDGGAEVNFEPGAVNQPNSKDHFDNLAEILPEEVLQPLGSDLNKQYSDYRASRSDWEKSYIEGLDLLGFKYNNRSEPFKGASGVTHPVLAEAVTQFQAQAYKELLPADGPVRTRIIGSITPQREEQSQRVQEFMNYQLMFKMKEYEPEFDQMLFYLPLSGSAFKKIYYDDLLGRAVSKFVPADDLVVPYSATSLDDADAVMHVIKVSENDLRKQQVAGFYRDVELPDTYNQESEVDKKEKELAGEKRTVNENIYTLIECHVNLDIEGFEDRLDDGSLTGIKLPYIVTIEESSRQVLSIRRNYQLNDNLKKKISYFVHFKFLPGLGFYGFGLIHMIGGLSRTATQALRQLLDAGTLSNLPAGFKMRGIRIRDDAQSIQPGEFRDVDAPGGNLREAFMTLPFKEPSTTLLQLMGVVVQAGQRFASIADMQVGDGSQRNAVGTTMALLERGSRVMSAIHKRMYVGLKQEFELLGRCFATYLPASYPYDVVGGSRMVKMQDFNESVDILPVADPNIFSQTQRITLAQTELQLASSQPKMHNLYNAYRQMYEALGVKNIDRILPRPAPQGPKDPALEHIDALSGKPFKAMRGQDHRAHMTAHLTFMSTNIARNNPMVMAALDKNILEHISLMAQEQTELEYADRLQMLQKDPALMQKFESDKAKVIAEIMEDFSKEEKKITSQFDNDPIAKLRSRELDIRQMENLRRGEEDKDRLELDRLKTLLNQMNQEEKREQNEELANLRADTSIQKTILSKTIPNN